MSIYIINKSLILDTYEQVTMSLTNQLLLYDI